MDILNKFTCPFHRWLSVISPCQRFCWML